LHRKGLLHLPHLSQATEAQRLLLRLHHHLGLHHLGLLHHLRLLGLQKHLLLLGHLNLRSSGALREEWTERDGEMRIKKWVRG
jgi:hypothetical protein